MRSPIPIKTKKLHPAAKLPRYAHTDAWGDLAAFADHALVDAFDGLSPQSVYQRFFAALPHLTEEMAHRLSHVNYTSRMALVATVWTCPGDRPADRSSCAISLHSAGMPGRKLWTLHQCRGSQRPDAQLRRRRTGCSQ